MTFIALTFASLAVLLLAGLCGWFGYRFGPALGRASKTEATYWREWQEWRSEADE